MIDQLRQKISRGQVEYSLHAVRQMVERNITPEEIAQTVLAGEVIEDYPDDKYGPSCLVCGTTKNSRVLHVQCTHPSRPLSLTPCFSGVIKRQGGQKPFQRLCGRRKNR